MDYAASGVGYKTPLVESILSGLDVHEAARLEILKHGIDLPRGIVKNGVFAILYGAGLDTLAWTIKGTREAASDLKAAIFKAAPEIKCLVKQVTATAEKRGFVFDWLGRIFQYPDTNFAYTACNALIQGGCADHIKVAMNQIDEFLLFKKSKMVLTLHDELVIEVHESEFMDVPKRVMEILNTTYPYKYVPLVASAEWSNKSLADKSKGYPV